MLRHLEQLTYEMENQEQTRLERVKLVGDFDHILKKFLQKMSEKLDRSMRMLSE